ncbi:hypothetical protein K443DRAFT_13230 [Laccaria amethystina LaAM-08-1]|uniref:Uncharacterized protein n=1 Tax=Laccaria amethystina LaAM-08-1 TaxID=1095629 RepID=A0A0C9WVY5_9AGAR|nr:hypothetical protein K443DRAFT_13230 [Laccaria amethystina LaAM-08-1]
MVHGLAKRNGTGIRFLHHCCQPSPPPPPHNPNPPPTLVPHPTMPAVANKQHHRNTVDVARRRFTWACHVDGNVQDHGHPSRKDERQPP